MVKPGNIKKSEIDINWIESYLLHRFLKIMDKNPSIMDYLQKSDVFKGLTNEQYTEIIKTGFPKKLSHKSMLFHQGDPATKCYLVNQGRLKLSKINEQGKEVIIRYTGAGELTAAVAILKDGKYPVSAQSIEKTEIIEWGKSTIIELMRKYPDIAINMLNILLENIDDLQHRYLELCTEHVEQRIARSLLRLMRRAGSRTSDGILIDIPLSRENVADYSGTTLYTVSRTLRSWEKNGWVQSARKRITITDPHALVLFAENS